MNLSDWEPIFEKKIAEVATADDPAHDLLHFHRVVSMAKKLCAEERGELKIVVPAAWLHDLVIIPKNDPRRSKASRLSAVAAVSFLKSVDYPEEFFEGIAHAIAAHSFSAEIECKTLEAKIVQDSDRLDGLGAIGVARCFATSGLLKRPFYESSDAFCETRAPDDSNYAIDHFYKKLFKTAETLKTASGIKEGQRRVKVMQDYLSALWQEVT